MKRFALPAAALLIVLLMGAEIYRAATSSLTHDEALTFQRFVDVPWARFFTAYDANNHVLHSLLVRLCVKVLGSSELVLRIPALAGGLLYLVIVFRLARFLLGESWLFLLGFATLALNPLILDYLSIARGYGMATALLLAAVDQLLRYSADPSAPGRLYRAALFLAFGVAANLTIVFPGVALVLAFTLLHLAEPAAGRDWPRLRHRAARLVDCLYLPVIVVSVGLLLFPMLKAERANFYYGAKSLWETSLSLVSMSLWRYANPLENTIWQVRIEPVIHWLVRIGVPALLALAATVALHSAWRTRPAAPLPVLALTAVLLLAFHEAAARWLAVPYPIRRTGLYWIPLFTLLLLLLVARAGRLAPLAALVPCFAIVLYLNSWETRYYDEWPFDAANRRLMTMLAHRTLGAARASVRVGANWLVMPGLDYYRRRLRVDTITLERYAPGAAYDYYVLLSEDQAFFEQRKLRPLFEDPLAQARLAVPPG